MPPIKSALSPHSLSASDLVSDSDAKSSAESSASIHSPSTLSDDPVPQELIKRSRRAVSRIVDGQALILDTSRDEIRQLNEVGSLIWSMILKSECTRDELLNEITSAFDVSRDEAEADLDEFLSSLEALNLIERIPQALD